MTTIASLSLFEDPAKRAPDVTTHELSIVIVNDRAMDRLRRCLESIEQTAGDLSHEVIVVDNGSMDGSAHFIRAEFPEVRLVVNQERAPVSRASNKGFEICQGRFILLLGNGSLLKPGTLDAMLKVMHRHPGIGLLGCRIRTEDGATVQSHGKTRILRESPPSLFPTKSPLYWLVKPLLEWKHSRQTETEWVRGAMLLRRQAIFDADLMDESFSLFYEEADLCKRIKQLGWKIVFTPEAEILHDPGAPRRGYSGRTRLELYRSRLLFFKKHYGPAAVTGLRFFLGAKAYGAYLFWLAKRIFKKSDPGFEERGRSILDLADLVLKFS